MLSEQATELSQKSEEDEKQIQKNQNLRYQSFNLSIKPFEGNNFQTLIDIDKKCFNVYDSYTQEMFESLLDENPNSFYVLYSDEKIIGYFIIYRYRRGGYLESIAIKPEYQGLGIGSYLMDYIINYYKLLRYKHITLEVRPNNFSAIRMYQRLGFEEVKKLKGYYKDGMEAILMKKTL
ncbi:MAG: ribosomal protein S18-alanine N-acetyltransferase [Flammeovirgaceae bacterium]